MKRNILIVLALMAMIASLLIASPVLAATSADVTITATPEYLAITVTDGGTNTWAIGAVAESTTKWYTSAGAAMSEPAVDGDGKITVTNAGSISENIKLHGHNFTGGVGWTISGTAVGENIVVIGAFKTGDANKAAVLKLTTSDQEYTHDLASTAHIHGGLYLDTGTFTDGTAKSTTITYTCEKHT